AELIEVLRNQAITIATLPPPLLALLDGKGIPQFHTVITGGEACPGEAVARWESGRRFINVYGPTEATCAVTTMECSGRYPQGPPIGRPMANSQAYILDRHLQPVPVGVAGEIHLGGAGLARGYFNRPGITAEKFIPNPYDKAGGGRLYKTGDLGRYLADGNIEFLGRLDEQVKLRGFRIELGEIEAVLRQHPGVRETAVVARAEGEREKRLIAYVVAEEETSLDSSQLRTYLRERLPDYMVPSAFMLLEELPLTPSGKVNRRALPDLQWSQLEAATDH